MYKNRIKYDGMIFNKYIDCKDIESKVLGLSDKLNVYYKDKEPLIVGVLNGCIYFMMDLLRNFNFKYTINFLKANSYTKTYSGVLKLEELNKTLYCNKNILIVEDIIDSGKTIDTLYKQISLFKPKEIKIITLLNKYTNSEKHSFVINWYGFDIKQKYVIGYGLDYNNLFRYLKDIYIEDEKEEK